MQNSPNFVFQRFGFGSFRDLKEMNTFVLAAEVKCILAFFLSFVLLRYKNISSAGSICLPEKLYCRSSLCDCRKSPFGFQLSNSFRVKKKKT